MEAARKTQVKRTKRVKTGYPAHAVVQAGILDALECR